MAVLLACACSEAFAGLEWETTPATATSRSRRTAAVADRHAYAPGAAGKVTAAVTVGRDWRGTKTKQILVRTDDPYESAVLFTLRRRRRAASYPAGDAAERR